MACVFLMRASCSPPCPTSSIDAMFNAHTCCKRVGSRVTQALCIKSPQNEETLHLQLGQRPVCGPTAAGNLSPFQQGIGGNMALDLPLQNKNVNTINTLPSLLRTTEPNDIFSKSGQIHPQSQPTPNLEGCFLLHPGGSKM